MQIFLSVWREFKRQKANLFFCAFFPAILVFILGTLLEQWNISDYEIPDIHAAYVTKEDTPAFTQYLDSLGEQGVLTVEKEETLKEAAEKLKDGLAAVIEYDAAGSQIILHQGQDEVINRALHIMLQGYASMERALAVCYENGVMPDAGLMEGTGEYVVPKKLGTERSMIDYYAVAMLVMILFMGSSMSCSMVFYEFRQSGLFDRVAITPAKKAKVFFMMILGNLPVAVIEVGAIMFFSTVFFGAHYCADIAANLTLMLYFFIVALTVSAFSAIIGLVVNFNPTAVVMPLSWIILFFGGSFAKDVFIKGISNRMPTWIIQQAAFDLTLFGNYDRVLLTGGWMLLCAAALLALGTVLFCGKKRR